jgi:formamidopyrimidine-DNA glycosylase
MLRFAIPSAITKLVGEQITQIDRRAKYLLIHTTGASVLSHLGMTGTWQRADDKREQHTHDHLRLSAEDGTTLVYNDPRKFGFIELFDREKGAPRLAELGPEPLDQAAFTADYLAAALHKRNAPIKSLLMDQAIVVGVGNIYAAEALFRSGIHPKRKAASVSKARLETLVKTVREVLEEAIEAGGSTIDDFRKINGQSGYFQHTFSVYAREGQPCLVCKRTLKLAKIGGRSSVYCPQCQK